MIQKFKQYYFTLRDLKFKQFWFRIPGFKKIGRKQYYNSLDYNKAGNLDFSKWKTSIPARVIYTDKNQFIFLNQKEIFEKSIDWDNQKHGLLWTYNLNYFEFLLQSDLDKDTGYQFIDEFLEKYPDLKVARDPYPISLRLIFWIRFFIQQKEQPKEKYINAIQNQARELQLKLEYHLLGNHLLENAFALCFCGLYLSDLKMFIHAEKLLVSQLNEQVLADGAHFELSTMYHHIMLYRLLDLINLQQVKNDERFNKNSEFLENTASKMLGWMRQMTFKNGEFPLFNDSANGIAPTPEEIEKYANRLSVKPCDIVLFESGYRKWANENRTLFIDVGNPAPDYQPGHAHCDALSFVMEIKSKNVFIDTGTSVYGGDSELRHRERSTKAHNTVQINNLEQSEIWGDFRVGRKTKVKLKKDEKDLIVASHNGFYFKKDIHQRQFKNVNDNKITITDTINKNLKGDAYFNFHPDIKLDKINESTFSFGLGEISFEGFLKIEEETSHFAPEFGVQMPCLKLKVSFSEKLITHIANL